MGQEVDEVVKAFFVGVKVGDEGRNGMGCCVDD